MFEKQLKDTIEYLISIKYDSFQALYYIDLLQNSVFQGLIKSVIEDNSIQNKEKVLLTAFDNSWRLDDLNFVLSIWGKNANDFTTENFDLDDLADEENATLVSKEENDTCKEENDTYNKDLGYFSDVIFDEEKRPECYYQAVYFVTGAADEAQEQQIVLRSNLFDLDAIVVEINRYLCDCIVNENNASYRLEPNKIADFRGFMFDCSTNPVCIDELPVQKIERENEIIIHGEADCLEDLSLFLRLFLSPLDDYIVVENIFNDVRAKIQKMSVPSKSIRIDRYIENEAIVEKCKASGVLTFGDLVTVVPHNLSIQEAMHLSSSITRFDIATPDQLLKQILKELRPREIEVIMSRYVFKQTLEEVGSKYGLTRERVRQLESKAIRKIEESTVCKKLKRRLDRMVKLHSKSKYFIAQSELSALYLPDCVGVFFDKILRILCWNSNLKIGFFNEGSMERLLAELEELPSEFTCSDMDDYAGLISLELNGEFSTDDVKHIIKSKYKTCGDFVVKGKLALKVVLSYLVELYFPEGFDLYDDEKIELLRTKALEHFDGYELAENNRAIRARLQDFCVPVGRGIWKLDTNDVIIPADLKESILRYINEYQVSVIPVQAIMDAFAVELELLEITNKYHLQGQLKKILNGVYDVNRDYIIKEDSSSIYEIIADFVKQSAALVTKHDIVKKFPGITDIVIQQTATNTKVLNMNGYYVHLDNLHISSKEQAHLKHSIDTVISDTSIYHSKVVFDKVRWSNAGLFSRIGATHYLQFYNLTKELFANDYAFNRPFMAKVGVEIISGEAQVLERIATKKEVSIAQVREFTKEVGTMIDRYLEFVDRNNDSIVFKNHNTLILIEETGIEDADFSSLDSVLATFMRDRDYRALNEFFDYWKLPELKIKWNEWLLYSIIGKYSKRFKTAVSSNVLQDAVPLLVGSEFDEKNIDFSNILISQYSEESDQEDLLDVLDYDDLM